MRSVVVTVDSPWPATGGVDLRNLQTVRALERLGPVDVVALGMTKSGPHEAARLGWYWSYSELASHRSWSERLVNRAWYVRPGSHWSCDMHTSLEAERWASDYADRRHPDLVIASQLKTGPVARALASQGARLIYDTHNIEARLRADLLHQSGDRGYKARIDVAKLRSAERRLARRCDQIWVCSEDDAVRLVEIHGQHPSIRVVPNTVEVGSPGPEVRDPGRILFVGSFPYRPNADAAIELIERILPRVQQAIPGATAHLVGRSPSAELHRIVDRTPGVYLHPDVVDVRPHLERAAVMVVPLRSGGGTRLKILEAMSAGTPVVTTSKGIEGIRHRAGVEALVADSSGGLAEGVVDLLGDGARRRALAAAGRLLVESSYSTAAAERSIAEAVESLLERTRN